MKIVKPLTIVLLIQLPFYLFSLPESAFVHYGLEDGLPSENVYDVEQDSEGYIWIATEAGLSRFNGKEFFNLNIEDGLPRNEVVNVEDDGYGNIWLNLSGPFSYYGDGKFHTIPNTINDVNWYFEMLVNCKGNTWINSNYELYLIDKNTHQIIENDLTKRKEIQLINVFNDTCLMYLNKKLLFTHNENIVDSLPLKNLENYNYSKRLTFCLDYPNLFYIADSTLHVINLINKKQKYIGNNIKKGRRLLTKVDDKLLLKDNAKGYTQFQLDSNNNIITRKKYLTQINISNFYVDKNQNLWVCAFNQSLLFFPSYFKKKASLIEINALENNPLHIIKNFDDEIWISTKQNKVARLSFEDTIIYNLPITSKYKNNRVVDITKLDEKTILFSTDLGFFTFENNQFKHKISTTAKKIFLKDNRLLLNTLSNTIETDKNSIINSAKETIYMADFVKKIDKDKVVSTERVYTSLIDEQNNYWLCVNSKGLVKINKNDTIYFNKISHLFNATFIDIININENLIALASTGNGIFIVNTNTHEFVNIDENEYLISNIVNSIFWFNNTLYVGTEKGLSIISNITGVKSKIRIQNLNKGNGLIYNNIKDIAIDDNGIHLVGQSGYQFVPKNYTRQIEEPNKKIKIESIIVNDDKEVDIQSLKSLQYNQNHLQFKIATFNFASNPNYNYVYQLKETESDWLKLGSEITYPNLSKGDYTLEIGIKTNNNSAEVDVIESVDFSIKPHFTESQGFKLIYLFGILGCFYLIFNFREKLILKKRIKEKTKLLQFNIEELARTNRELKQSNQELVVFANICSHDLKTPLRNINSFTALLYKKYKISFDKNDFEFYNFIDAGVKKMYQIIDDLIQHTKINNNKTKKWISTKQLLNKYTVEHKELIQNNKVEIKIESPLPDLLYNYSDAQVLFYNLISNAIQYNTNPYPLIKIGCIERINYFKFYIKDNGIGIEKEYFGKIFKLFNRLHNDTKLKGTGVGLALCKKIVEKYEGKIWVESSYGKGSTFYFTIIKNRKDFSQNAITFN